MTGDVQPATAQESQAQNYAPIGSATPRLFWHALAVFGCALLLSWTLGALLQHISITLGLAFTEIFFFALPAWWFLRRHGTVLGKEPFAPPPVKVLPWVILTALCMIVVAVGKGVALRKSLGLPMPNPALSPWLLVVMGTFAPVCEELVMRPVLQRALAHFWSPRNTVFAVALLFGLLHGSWLRFGETFILGLFTGILFLKTGNYWVCVLFHAISNFVGPTLFPYAREHAWLAHPATAVVLVLLAICWLWRIAPERVRQASGFRARLNAVLFEPPAPVLRVPGTRAMPFAFWGTVAVLAVLLSATLGFELQLYRQASANASQTDEWSLAKGDIVNCRTTLRLNEAPSSRPWRFTLPLARARLLAVSVDDAEAKFSLAPGEQIEVTPPVLLTNAAETTIMLTWQGPLAELATGSSFIVSPRPLVPLNRYSMTLRLEPDCGWRYQRVPRDGSSRELLRLNRGHQTMTNLGTWGLGISRAQ